MHDILLNLIGVGFIIYGLWSGATTLYEWTYNRGYNDAQKDLDTPTRYQVDSLKERLAKLEGKK